MWKPVIAAVIILLAGIGIGTQLADPPGGTTKEAAATTSRCAMHPTVISDQPGECPICGMDMVADQPIATGPAGEPKIAYWRAPMDANYTSDGPGKSPMGMDLIPVYEDELSQNGTVTIDPVTVQNIGVRTATVERRPLQRNVRTVGRVDYDETRRTDVNTKIAGWVEKLYVDFTGQQVTVGQPLLEIYSPDLVAAQEEYLTALDYHRRLQVSAAGNVVSGASDLLAAAAQRLRYWDITAAQIGELERAQTVQRRMTIYSPQQGVVTHKSVLDGQYVKPGEHLYRIAELSTVWVLADIYEYELPWLKTGQQATVTLSYLPGKAFTGRITYIDPYLNPKTRTATARIILDNPVGELKPGMYAEVEIKTPVSGDAVVVPVQAIIHSGRRRVAIVSLGEGRFQPRDIEVGVESEGNYQVLQGLREGETIVTSAQFLIDSESNLKEAVSAMRGSDKNAPEVRSMSKADMTPVDHSQH
jgi:Cu(I)/Ag(I) efflux system membrane fusion protein/cobalt-zinc-cadmium efflux system membrane fusion protein